MPRAWLFLSGQARCQTRFSTTWPVIFLGASLFFYTSFDKSNVDPTGAIQSIAILLISLRERFLKKRLARCEGLRGK